MLNVFFFIFLTSVANAARQNAWKCLFQGVWFKTSGSSVSGQGQHGQGGRVLSKVTHESATASVHKALVRSYLCNHWQWQMLWPVVKLEAGGFCNRWFLGFLGPVQQQALKTMGQTPNWHGCRLDCRNRKWGPRVMSLGQLRLLSLGAAPAAWAAWGYWGLVRRLCVVQ